MRMGRRRVRKRRRIEMKRRGPRIVLGKVRKRRLYYLSSASSYFFNNNFFCLMCDLNV